jgi:phage FluMu protein Com
MNFRYNIKCDICDNFLIVKVQGGFVEKAKVRFGCPYCKSVLKGDIYQNAPDISIKFENAELVKDIPDKEVDIFSISTELPIAKDLTNMKNVGGISLSPFIALSSIIPLEKVTNFRDRYLEFRDFRNEKLLKLETIIELFQNKQWDYVFNEIKKSFLPGLSDDSIRNMEFSTHIVSQVLKSFINKVIPQNYEHSYTIRLLHKNTLTKVQNNKTVLSQLNTELGQYVNIEREFVNASIILLNFIQNIESYLPVIALSYGKGFEEEFNNEFFITTFSFDELRDKYKDSFELLARTSLIYIGFSNYVRNGVSNDFSDIDTCRDLSEYYRKDNGKKKEVLEKVPLLKKYYRFLLNSQLRNSIGHNKTEYFTVEQMIRYYPYTDIRKKDRFKEKSLVDFAYHTYLMNLAVMDFVSFIGKWNYRMN